MRTNNHQQRLSSIYFYVPNLICYLRVIIILIPLATAFKYPIITICACIISISLDALDGAIARYLGQESRLGQLLDYAVDRASLTICCTILAVLIPAYWWFFTLIAATDISSHFAHLYGTVFSKEKHHKTTSRRQNRLLRAYYEQRMVMFFACASHDLLLAAIYLDHFFHSAFTSYMMIICIPGFAFKSWIHLLQIAQSTQAAVNADHQPQHDVNSNS